MPLMIPFLGCYAGVAELVYAHALGACLARDVGSSPTACIDYKYKETEHLTGFD